MSKLGAWPASGEIDINEYRTGLPGRAVPRLHHTSSGLPRHITNWHCRVTKPHAYHTYVLRWSRSRMSFRYDGTYAW